MLRHGLQVPHSCGLSALAAQFHLEQPIVSIVEQEGHRVPDADTIVRRAKEAGVLVSAFATRTVRAVTHLDVNAAQCRQAADVLAKAVET